MSTSSVHARAKHIVDAFEAVWADPRAHRYRFLEHFSPEVVLRAPLAGRTRGRAAGYAAFRRTFALLPDLTAQVDDWSVSERAIYISMTFRTAVRGPFEWRSVDVLQLSDDAVVQRGAYFDPLPLLGYLLRHPSLVWRWVRLRRGAPPRSWPDGSTDATTTTDHPGGPAV